MLSSSWQNTSILAKILRESGPSHSEFWLIGKKGGGVSRSPNHLLVPHLPPFQYMLAKFLGGVSWQLRRCRVSAKVITINQVNLNVDDWIEMEFMSWH